jgi:hypothetical protein
MILVNKKNDAFIELELQEVETDRANGIELKVHIKRKYLNAKFFYLWIEKDDLSRFIKNLKRVVAGKASIAKLNSPTRDDLYLVLVRKGPSFYIGVRVTAYNFTPTKLKDSVALSFEIGPESIPTFIKELERVLAKL